MSTSVCVCVCVCVGGGVSTRAHTHTHTHAQHVACVAVAVWQMRTWSKGMHMHRLRAGPVRPDQKSKVQSGSCSGKSSPPRRACSQSRMAWLLRWAVLRWRPLFAVPPSAGSRLVFLRPRGQTSQWSMGTWCANIGQDIKTDAWCTVYRAPEGTLLRSFKHGCFTLARQ